MDVTSEFEASRAHLRGIAYRMLGSLNEADDAVQEAWLRLSRSDTQAVENLRGWLTLRSRASRREQVLDAGVPERPAAGDPEHEAMLADSVGLELEIGLVEPQAST